MGGRSPRPRTARPRRIRVHFQSNPAAPAVFHMTWERYRAAAARHPDAARLVEATIGTTPDELDAALGEADALVGWRFPRDLAARAPRLRWIHVWGAGVEHLVPFDWLPPGVVLTNNRGVHAPKAAEYLTMALLMLNSRMPELIDCQRARRWCDRYTTVVAGKTLVVVGVGAMGGTAARCGRRLGLRVVGVRRSGRPHRFVDEMVGPDGLDEVLPRADFVVVTAPLTPETRGLFDRRRLDRLPPTASLVNLGRAAIVDYDALADKLRRGELAGAILDVFDPEPLPAASPLWSTPRLVITPHVASDDDEAYMPRTLDLVFENVRRLAAGRALRNRVDPDRGY